MTKANTEITRFNALRHGLLSQHTVLPWEDRTAYDQLVDSLVSEHAPQGPTEEHLVEELAGILWRKRRLRLAEAAAHHRGLSRSLDYDHGTAAAALVHLRCSDESEPVSEAVQATAKQSAEEMDATKAVLAMTCRALTLTHAKAKGAYANALAALHEDTQEWWSEVLALPPERLEKDEKPATADVKGLRCFIETKVLPWLAIRKQELANRILIREQAFGEALDPDKLEQLGRYEVHLDRKLERVLSMLLRLKDLRLDTDAEGSVSQNGS